jgi:hypothetical protein
MRSKLDKFNLHYERDRGFKDIRVSLKQERRSRIQEMLFVLKMLAVSMICAVGIVLVLIKMIPDKLRKR